jgi:extracellular factor (EF) 3-hydroxypalmitic acid methyl ester biosynthesis protein
MPVSDVLIRVRAVAIALSQHIEAIEVEVAENSGGDQLDDRVTAALGECLKSLTELNIWGPENRLPSSEIWNIAGHWLRRGWLQNHARTKPRGYAGDHEMLARIYEHALCDDPLGRLFDRYFQAQAAPQVVRNRMRMMTKWIGEALAERRSPKVAVVGSAFGLEVRDALLGAPAAARQSLTVTLLDLDPAALEFARVKLEPLMPREHLVLEPANLFRLPDRPALAAKLSDSDLIICPGLFDYLDDSTAMEMIRCLFGKLAPAGRLVVFQFAPHNPTRAYMEWLGNWYLTYRDQASFRQLFEQAKLERASVEIDTEPLGIDLYAKVSRAE